MRVNNGCVTRIYTLRGDINIRGDWGSKYEKKIVEGDRYIIELNRNEAVLKPMSYFPVWEPDVFPLPPVTRKSDMNVYQSP